MNYRKKMEPVADIAQQQVDIAARCVAECNQVYLDTHKQLDELLSYRDDYQNGMRHKGHTRINASQINDYSLFMLRLDRAIEQQKNILDGADTKLTESKEVWLEKQQRAKAIASVVSRYQQLEQRDQSRREQCESDEHAQHFLRTYGS